MKIEFWIAAGASCTGRSHITKGMPCQDQFVTANDKWPKAVVLADGAGSAKYAEVGAKIAVNTTMRVIQSFGESLQECSERDLKEQIYLSVLNDLNVQAENDGGVVGDYASTLLFAATDGVTNFVGNLGDGVVLEQTMSGNVRPCLKPQRGEYASSTFMTTSEGANSVFEVKRIPVDCVSGFALLTDGASGVMYDSRKETVSPAVRKMLDWFNKDEPMEGQL